MIDLSLFVFFLCLIDPSSNLPHFVFVTQALGSVETVVFDKTGTLTQGRFVVANLENVGDRLTRVEM